VRRRKNETRLKPAPASVSESTPPAQAAEPDNPSTPTSDIRLVVCDVSAAGVLLGFHAGLLQRVAFRASMPQRCLICGDREPKNLIARPVVWIDKAHGKYLSPGETEQHYEVHPHGHQTARSLVESMRAIEELPPPLNNPIPYYVCQGCSSKLSVRGEAMASADGVTCEVLIPTADYALEWLGRVNGVCGADYEKLEETTGRLEDETWAEIPEKIRSRLSAWFDFVGSERFLQYFADTDFTRADAGLAGLVVTTDRLVYCKYHHHGSIGLDDESEQLQFREDGAFFDVSHVHDDHVQKMVRLRRGDIEALEQLLDDLPFRFRVEFIEAQEQP
ncbi:MAG: hypothetical protein OER86_04290, partial [Phycisphaerae bacterium]|nr:hypothetical protein [Phycisphaerae bacterium]